MDMDLIYNLVSIVICLLAIFYLYYTGQEAKAKRIILQLVIEAEQVFKSGEGQKKFAYVLDKLYGSLPSIIQFFMSKQKLSDLIEDAVSQLKDKLQ